MERITEKDHSSSSQTSLVTKRYEKKVKIDGFFKKQDDFDKQQSTDSDYLSEKEILLECSSSDTDGDSDYSLESSFD